MKVARAGDRYVITPDAAREQVPLKIGGCSVAGLTLSFFQEVDRTSRYMKTAQSFFTVISNSEREPLIRLEYDASHQRAVSHWQIHAERGAFTELLTRANLMSRVQRPYDISKLHFPTGGERFRPALEDFLEFLLRECGFDAVSGWKSAIKNSREAWRRLQFRTAVRELPREAADILRREGWTVNEPSTGSPKPWRKPYRRQ